MTLLDQRPRSGSRVLRTVEEAVAHVRAICFKTGPPRLVGVELEWTVHHTDDPARDLDLDTLRSALGPHAPRTLDPPSPHQPLSHGAVVTVEPGGQVEISTPPARSLTELHRATSADLAQLADRLADHGLRLGGHGLDPHRRPRRLLTTPRYDAMAARFADHGPAGLAMMGATAATQVCLDAGEPEQVDQRWWVVQALGPVLLALFTTSTRPGWACSRMRTWLEMDPARTAPVPLGGDPATAWARYALSAPLLCLRHRQDWQAPEGVTFSDWIAGELWPPPTVDDLEYHLSTLFPPVRPQGYLEARYLDAQDPAEWFVPVALLAALLRDPETIRATGRLVEPVADAWQTAARTGLTDPALAATAAELVDLGCHALAGTDLPAATRRAVESTLTRRLAERKE